MALTAAEIANLKTIRANLISHLTTESANPKPTYSIGGQSVQWHAYYEQKMKEVDIIDKKIEEAENAADAWEVRSQGRSG